MNGMTRMTTIGSRALAVLLAVTILSPAVVTRAQDDEEMGLTHRHGRVSINLPDNGSFAVCRFEGGRCGIIWPREGGAEYLGFGGLFLRYRKTDDPTYRIVFPASFEAVDTGVRRRLIFEGCEGGKRFPHRGSDDDGDGFTDEDRLDGKDNDGDGLVDEDFAAIGDGMVSTRSVEPADGLVLDQCSYTWDYGHVRDFIGFTTLVEFPVDKRKRDTEIRDLSIVLYADFNIGDPEDEQRGSDDRFFYIRNVGRAIGTYGGLGYNEDRDPETGRGLPAASDHESAHSFVTVLVLGATGPSGAPLEVGGFITERLDHPDSLWNYLMLAQSVSGSAAGEQAFEPGADRPGAAPGDIYTYGAVDGDVAIAHLFWAVPRLKPGDRVKIEWALVFGNTEAAFLKNVGRAIETYSGVVDEEGALHRWVVPARRAVRREIQMTLASIWSDGRRQPAAALSIPTDLEPEEVEWVRVDGCGTTLYERVGSKIVLPLDRELVARAEPFTIEGQLTDGTIFTARPNDELLKAYGTNGDLPPDRLPENSMHLFPNPFLTSLTIDVNVPGPSAFVNSTGHELEGTSSVRVYDVRGRLVRTIVDEEILHPGSYQLGWDGLDENGANVAPGVYYCKLQIGARSLTKRVILLR
jgi:hypothetical protein